MIVGHVREPKKLREDEVVWYDPATGFWEPGERRAGTVHRAVVKKIFSKTGVVHLDSDPAPLERVYLVVPNSYFMVPQEEMTSFAVDMTRLLSSNPEVKIGVYDYLSNLSIAAARNYHSHVAMELGVEWLWFVDTDHRFPPGCMGQLYATALQLRKKFDAKFLCVGGLYYGRTWNHPPMGLDRSTMREELEPLWKDPNTTYEQWRAAIDATGKTVFESTTVATGFMLVNVPALKKFYESLVNERAELAAKVAQLATFNRVEEVMSIQDPTERESAWVALVADLLNHALAFQAHKPALFVGQYTPKGELVTTEDYYFTYSATTKGFRCFIDTRAEVQHMIREMWYPKTRADEPTPRPPAGQKFEVAGDNTDGLVTRVDDTIPRHAGTQFEAK
ncbi:MAG: hypothetical protein JW839_02185 [Candidatus Lokiarchaeota archaeon]|nr:hypothetical protein [Candidatus Lokiarchaeota archaeon]